MSIIEGRNAEILQSIIDGTPYENPNPYPSRIEQLLMELKEVIEQGGGGATDAYTKAQTDALLDAKADLVDGKIPASELPSYVDDVVEYASTAAFPATGESGKIYVATDTNKTYRWGGSAYVEISESLALGETASTAYAGNKGKANADAIAAIKDGTNIDSFADVEAALANIPSVTVDQTYNPQSTNPQSGIAVASALKFKKIADYLQVDLTSTGWQVFNNVTATIEYGKLYAVYGTIRIAGQIEVQVLQFFYPRIIASAPSTYPVFFNGTYQFDLTLEIGTSYCGAKISNYNSTSNLAFSLTLFEIG